MIKNEKLFCPGCWHVWQMEYSHTVYLLSSSNQDEIAVSTNVFWPPNVDKKNFYFILLGHFNSLLFYVLTFHIWNKKGDGSHNINIFVLNHCDIVWLPVCVCVFVLGSLVVFFVGLPGEASVAWSPLLHQTAGQEMCSAPQHSGRIHFVPLSSILYVVTNVFAVPLDPVFLTVYTCWH